MAKRSQSDILLLIESAQNNDQQAFTKLLDHFWSEVYHFILSKNNGNESEAEDVSIQTFSKAFEKLHTYNAQYQFNTWLLTIAKNIWLDGHRKNAQNDLVSVDDYLPFLFLLPDEENSLEDQLIHEQNLAVLKQYIKQLKPHYQQIIQLRYFQERSYKEIAEIIGEPLNNVKIKILRAKKLLIEKINAKH